MTSWTCLDTDHPADTHNHMLSPRADTHADIRNEFTKIFHENNLDILANPSEIGISELTRASTQASSAMKDRTYGFPDTEIPFVKSEPKQEYASNSDALARVECSPTKSTNFKGDGLEGFNFRPESPCLSSKENYFYPYHLRSDRSNLKNFPDFHENENFMNDYDEGTLDLMWDQDDLLQRQRNPNQSSSNEHKMAKSLKLNFGDSDEDEDTLPMNDFHRQNPFSKAEEDLNKIFTRRVNSGRSLFSAGLGSLGENFDNTLDTRLPLDFNSNNLSFPFAEGEDEDPYYDLKGRSSRGLRVLSLRVKDVVRMKEKTSYKDVAEFLTKEVNQRLKNNPPGEGRDDQNVKRRVYDALNVLIAADILQKDGKVVFCGAEVDNIGIHRKRELAFQRARITKRKEKAENKVQKKKRELQELMFKVLAIKNVVRRNQEVHGAIEADPQPAPAKEEPVKKTKQTKKTEAQKVELEEEQKIRFPFILVPSQAQGSMNLRTNKSKTNMLVESKLPLNIFGDTDVLLKLKLHYVTKDFLSEALSTEVHKYIPSLYLESIK